MKSHLDASSSSFQENQKKMLEGIGRLTAGLARANEGGGEKYNSRHTKKGRLLPRERIEYLLDEGSYFLEIASLAGCDSTHDVPGASVVGGIGVVSGVECLIVANEATVRAGAMTETGATKLQRLAEISIQNRLPTVYLVESAGVDLPNQGKIFVRAGREFRDITRRSKARIPTISVVFGTSTAGGAYIPGMSDYIVMVKNQARVFLAGPPLVKMATGEVVADEPLGGAEMHSRISGVSDFLAESELEAIRTAREIIRNLNWGKKIESPKNIENPLYSSEEILGIPSANPRIPFDMREIFLRVFDGSKFFEFKPTYGSTLVTAYAHIHGFPVGVLANNGILDSQSSGKGAQFIHLCNQQNIPLLFLQNITGFMVGKKFEEEGIIRNGAKMINAVANSTVPMITIMVGCSYGAGNYAMCGRAYDPRFLFSWPSHKIAVMGGQQLGGVMEIIKREAAEKAGTMIVEDEIRAIRQKTEDQIEKESDAFFATSRIWDDGIIDPRDTRSVVGICLSAVRGKAIEGTMEWGVFRH